MEVPVALVPALPGLLDTGGISGMAPGVAGGTGFTCEPPVVPGVSVPVVAVVIAVLVTEDDGGAAGLTGARAGRDELVTTDEPAVVPDMPAADDPETVLAGAGPVLPAMADDPETVLAGAGAALTPGGGAKFSVVTTLAPAGGSGSAGAPGGMVSPVAGAPDARAVAGRVKCWPTRIRYGGEILLI